MCFIYAFFVLQLFELSIFDLASVLVCLLSLLSFSPWALTPPPHLSSSVIVCQRRRMTESASRFSHHSKPLVYCSFWFLPHVPHLDLHLLHISLLNSQVALCSSSFFPASSIKIWSLCFLKLILDILIQRIIITISHSSPSSPSVHIL